MERIEELKKEIEELKEELNDTQKDFLNDYGEDLTDTRYLEDLFSEFADNSISVYCADQEEYYHDHQEECEWEFRSMGYELKDFDTIEEAIYRAGVCGWYAETYGELCEKDRLNDLKDLQEELKELEEEEQGGEE